MPLVDFDEDECTLLLIALQEYHVSLQGVCADLIRRDQWEEADKTMESINRLEERIKEAE